MFNEGRFKETLIYLDRVDKLEHSAPLLFKRGICHYEINEIDKALGDFKRAWEYGYKNELTDYYLGLIFHQKGQFREAAEYYKSYLSHTDIDAPDRERVRLLVSQCGHAMEIAYQKPIAIVDNPGKPVNSQYNDFGWIHSPNQPDNYYFSTDRPNTVISMARGHHEIYQVSKETDGKWSKPTRLSYPINSRSEEILAGINDEGDGLILYRREENESEFLIHTRGSQKGKQKSIPIPAKFTDINAEVFFYKNELILFSAELPGGYGGMDIYAIQEINGHWGDPVNLGPTINSFSDELTPYIVNEGNIIYFSSNRSESIGGFDIFKSIYLYESRKWSPPENLGIPMNSPGDDLGFRLGQDGLSGIYSSDRKNSFGGRDIYFAKFFKPQEGQEFYAGEVPFLKKSSQWASNETTIEVTQDIESDTSTTSSEMVTADLTDEIEKETFNIDPVTLESVDSKDVDLAPITQKTYRIAPLFYTANRDILSEENLAKIAEVKELLDADANAKIELISHTNSDGIVEYNLYSSLKRAEKVKNQLIQAGIESDRIILKGLGDNYPLIKKVRDGGDPRLAEAYNPRLDFKIHNLSKGIELKYEDEIDVSESMVNISYDLFRAIVDGSVSYKIQIATVQQMYRGLALSLFNDSAIEPEADSGLYSYTIGLYDSYAQAVQTKRDLEREGLVDVKVIPYIDGLRVDEDQLVYYVNQYPDLKNFMNYDKVTGSN